MAALEPSSGLLDIARPGLSSRKLSRVRSHAAGCRSMQTKQSTKNNLKGLSSNRGEEKRKGAASNEACRGARCAHDGNRNSR
ncbi:hypothetical protein CISG_04433 [Coccidioides immitis RMSCC 3703]|uniref:Uncharacterized protein n=1 Tax=Coccidioides immitis RMSCC 3703 TaxID=454286 RepID=A0A0J8QQB3_COCIT|nr:hypothetical protein CISG_04433 [Coccidioides immitis RMSCC 3703]